MAYYLDEKASSGSDGYVAFPSYGVANNADFSIKFKVIVFNSAGYKRLIGRAENSASDININGDNQIIIQNESGSSIQLSLPISFVIGEFAELEVTRIAGVITVSANGSESTGNLGGSFRFDQFFRQGSFTSGGEFAIAWVKLDSARKYENTSGSGSVLPDLIGGQDGTLVNFPTDDSQWVFYDDGTGTAEDALTAQSIKAQTSTTTPALTQSHQLTPASLRSSTETTRATLAQAHTLAPVSIISASNTTTGTLAQAHTLAPTGLTSTTTTSTPTLAQIHTLIPASLKSQSSTTNTSLSDQSTVDNLTAANLKSTSATNTPAFTQAHSLTASDTASATSSSTPTLAQVHTLIPANLTASTNTTTATLQSIAGQDALTSTDLTASTSTTTGTLAQIHTLTPQSLAVGTSTTTASITQVHGLAASNVVSITSTNSPILRNASVVLARPITNTKAAAIQATYKATPMITERKAVTIQADYKVRVG